MTICPKYTLFALAVIVFATGTVRTWDLGVVIPTRLQFLKENVVERSAAYQLSSMAAIAYNPITKDIYVSDSNQNAGSIFRIKTTGDAAYTVVEPIVAKQDTNIHGMAFDERTSTLYWTTGNGLSIKYVHVPENAIKEPLVGNVLLKFKEEIPLGIAIDTCRGYLYWTNINHSSATIERSLLNGSERKVLINKGLFQPLGIAVDVDKNRLYWSNEREGIYYSIESSDLEGNSRVTLVQGMHHQPYTIVLDEHKLYWSDWVGNTVWNVPKDSFQGGVEPVMVVKYLLVDTPMGLVTPYNTSSRINDTHCTVHKAENDLVITETTVEPISYAVLRNFCKNRGVLHSNGTCICQVGFVGDYCEEASCYQYCKTGTCTINSTRQPVCQCPAGRHGKQCEKQLCSSPCLNNGQCILDTAGTPKCECQVGYIGDTCQFRVDWFNQLCPVFCQNASKISESQHSFCSCDKFDSNNHSEKMASSTDLSSCQFNKSMLAVIAILTLFVASLGTITLVLTRKVRLLGRRPRIKKRIVVNRSITPLQTCRPPQQQNQQCEITIENCCNMNICETPCFEPDFRSPKMGGMLPSKKLKKDDKVNLLSSTDMSSEDEKPSY